MVSRPYSSLDAVHSHDSLLLLSLTLAGICDSLYVCMLPIAASAHCLKNYSAQWMLSDRELTKFISVIA